MPAFISLVDFTQQGVQNFKASPERAAEFRAIAEKLGVTVKDVYWTMGAHDAVIIAEAPDPQTITAAMLALASLGNVRTQTLQAFDAAQVKEIIDMAPAD
jgi:uncharacterized protein with GYD domain